MPSFFPRKLPTTNSQVKVVVHMQGSHYYRLQEGSNEQHIAPSQIGYFHDSTPWHML